MSDGITIERQSVNRSSGRSVSKSFLKTTILGSAVRKTDYAADAVSRRHALGHRLDSRVGYRDAKCFVNSKGFLKLAILDPPIASEGPYATRLCKEHKGAGLADERIQNECSKRGRAHKY